MRGWAIFGVAFLGLYLYITLLEKEQRYERWAAEKAACQANPTCRDKEPNRKAMSKSLSSPAPVLSTTGLTYFKGDVCSDDCSDHVAGYEWAELRGISKNAGCTKGSLSFLKGCRQYAGDRAYELENKGRSEHDERESCMPGRYGDC